MRRFECKDVEMFVYPHGAQDLSKGVLVKPGQIALLEDDDPRCDTLASHWNFRELGDEEPEKPVKRSRAKDPEAESEVGAA